MRMVPTFGAQFCQKYFRPLLHFFGLIPSCTREERKRCFRQLEIEVKTNFSKLLIISSTLPLIWMHLDFQGPTWQSHFGKISVRVCVCACVCVCVCVCACVCVCGNDELFACQSTAFLPPTLYICIDICSSEWR